MTVAVTLHDQAAVGVRQVTVGDVADITGANAPLCKMIAQLDLAGPIRQSGALSISRNQVAIRIQLAGLPNELIRIEGADRVEVVAAQYQVPEADVLAAARKAVLIRLASWKPEDIDIRQVRPIMVPLSVAGTREDVSVRAELHAAAQPLGLAQVDVSLLSGGERKLSFPLYLEIRACPQVAVMARKVEKGEWVTESSVIFERRTVESKSACVTTSAMLAGKKARQPLNAGQVLTLADLEIANEHPDGPLVHQRNPVKMIVHLGTMSVVASGEAMQDGRLGQMIRVRNIDSKQQVVGRVADRSLVEIDP